MSRFSDAEDRAWHSGYSAYERGKPSGNCPYNVLTLLRYAWLDGWEAARYEYEDTPPNE